MGSARIDLGYGARRVAFRYDAARFDVLAVERRSEPVLSNADLLASLEAPIASPPLGRAVGAGDRVVVVVPDATRASGSDRLATALLHRLRAMGLADQNVSFLIGGGTHRPPTPDEVLRIVGSEVARAAAVHAHDAFSDTANVHIGETPRGTPVELNRRLLDADRVILVGSIGFHYFAGFSGGRKALLPACASDRAIQANHLLGFDREHLRKAKGVATASLDGNPVSEDMEDAARLLGPTFLVNTVLDARDQIVAVYAGDWFRAHRAGCADYLASHSVRARERRPVVVVSAGGAPRDLNMIQSHKALEHARLLAEEGGDLVLLAECGDGLGRPDWLDWFAAGDSTAMAANLVRNYRIYGQTAWGVRWKTEVYRTHLVSALPAEQVRAMGMIPHASLDEAVAACGEGLGWILPHGLATLPLVDDASTATFPAGVFPR